MLLKMVKAIELESAQPPKVQLSQRELEVLKLVIEGYNNTEIARTLHLSPNTVKCHMRGILNKLGVEHRIQAAVFALRNNLV
ncbi:MAG: hypothetical protein Kow00121_59730 [Elainellaceae cyanobacterium]